MPIRPLRAATNLVFHVMNRAARRIRLFEEAADYEALLRAFEEGRSRTGIDIFAYCVMPNHFHLLVRQLKPNQLSDFMRWSQLTHARRWRQYRDSVGFGAVYQGRYQAIPIQTDQHFVAAARYVERNPLRANLVAAAEEWPWSSLAQRCRNSNALTLTAWPIPPSEAWVARLNVSEPAVELDAIRRALRKGLPFGGQAWSKELTGASVRPKRRGRPPQNTTGAEVGLG